VVELLQFQRLLRTRAEHVVRFVCRTASALPSREVFTLHFVITNTHGHRFSRVEYNKCKLSDGTSAWAACVAVLVPGVPQELSVMLLAATREAAERKGYLDVLAALPKEASFFDRKSMYVLHNLCNYERGVYS
jgi:hypothetical protein